MGKFRNLMERVTTKTWSKLLKGTLCQGIQAFIGMRIFSIQVFLLVWRRREIILLLTRKTGSHHNLLQCGGLTLAESRSITPFPSWSGERK